MRQALDRTGGSDTFKTGPTKMPGTGQIGRYPRETTSELLQSIGAAGLDSTDKTVLQVAGQLSGSVQAVHQQQNPQILLTPASLQLAQLQAQLTLQRLKLAQGGNSATASTVLNQVLSNVAMSQSLFNQPPTSTMVGNAQTAFPMGMLGFPSSNSALGALVGRGFNQNPGNVRLNHPGAGGAVGQQSADYGKTSGSIYSSDAERHLQCSLAGGTSSASASAGEGQYSVINTQATNMNSTGFQRDFNGHDILGQQARFCVNEQNMNMYNSAEKVRSNLNHHGKVDMVSNATSMWTAAGQPVRSRTELYNPEEPTPDPKFNPNSGVASFGSSGTQGFGRYQNQHGGEETPSSGTRTLQPHQVNDYHAVTPAQLPHQCSICDKKVYNLKDWDQHVNGKLHLQNRTLYTNESSAAVSAGGVHYNAGGPCDGALNPGGTNSMAYSTASQDVSNSSNLPAAAMKTFPMSDTGFPSGQPELKPFPPRTSTVGRVVHICNLPEGSCTENDVINLGIPFGKVTNYILMRSTHQAFVEMAYIEAAQAMVQYYQLSPATVNNQKLLIRMSKRYKELQLKKPGKDVQSIIQDISSQRDRDEVQDLEHYIPERTRSRSPVSHSLSSHSHSPSFTSCSSAHSPQGALCRGLERCSNGLGARHPSYDWSSRRGEEEREREDPWRNGGSLDDGRSAERRKTYQKPLDHAASRCADERAGGAGGGGGGGGGGGEVMRGGRDWHQRGSPQSFSSYRNMEDDFYVKEQIYKSEKQPRAPYQRHDHPKAKRREGGDYHGRARHSEFEMTEETHHRRPEEKRQSSPGRGRSRKTSRRHSAAEKPQRENAAENSDRKSKEKSVSPHQSTKPKEATECSKEAVNEWESEDDSDEECWYPKNMEELVTVDEVGGEDDSIIEPDLPVLEKVPSCPKESAEGGAEEESVLTPPSSMETQETSHEKSKQEKFREDVGELVKMSVNDKPDNVSTGSEDQKLRSPAAPAVPAAVLSEEFKATPEETCSEKEVAKSDASEKLMENHLPASEENETPDPVRNGVQHKNGGGTREIKVRPPPRQPDRAVSERSIPLGVEFIVPRTGFFCKLCGLFYTSEDAAKTTHCRSTVHYRNLQKYLSQLAEESLSGNFAEATSA